MDLLQKSLIRRLLQIIQNSIDFRHHRSYTYNVIKIKVDDSLPPDTLVLVSPGAAGAEREIEITPTGWKVRFKFDPKKVVVVKDVDES